MLLWSGVNLAFEIPGARDGLFFPCLGPSEDGEWPLRHVSIPTRIFYWTVQFGIAAGAIFVGKQASCWINRRWPSGEYLEYLREVKDEKAPVVDRQVSYVWSDVRQLVELSFHLDSDAAASLMNLTRIKLVDKLGSRYPSADSFRPYFVFSEWVDVWCEELHVDPIELHRNPQLLKLLYEQRDMDEKGNRGDARTNSAGHRPLD